MIRIPKVTMTMRELDRLKCKTSLHPTIKAASSITRSESRRTLLSNYQDRQREYRRWRNVELEFHVALLTISHVAMLRAVGELGGFAMWAIFFDDFQQARNKLDQLRALPLDSDLSRRTHNQSKRMGKLGMAASRHCVWVFNSTPARP
jgi:hypothetical protein